MGAQSTSAPLAPARELAVEGGGGGDTPRLLTESEAYAVAAAEVRRETAAKDETIATLTSEKAELQTKLDTADATVATEKARADKAEQDLVDERAKAETEKAQLARVDSRVAAVKEKAAHLADDFYTDERKARWAAMDDESFDGWLAELAALQTGLVPATGTGTAPVAPAGATAPPAETAMQGQSGGTGDAPTTGNGAKLLAFQRGA